VARRLSQKSTSLKMGETRRSWPGAALLSCGQSAPNAGQPIAEKQIPALTTLDDPQHLPIHPLDRIRSLVPVPRRQRPILVDMVRIGHHRGHHGRDGVVLKTDAFDRALYQESTANDIFYFHSFMIIPRWKRLWFKHIPVGRWFNSKYSPHTCLIGVMIPLKHHSVSITGWRRWLFKTESFPGFVQCSGAAVPNAIFMKTK